MLARILPIVIVALASYGADRSPAFRDFPVRETFEGSPAKPLLRTACQKKFATQIREQAFAPANFAGHYKIAEWGCGSSCVSIAIINLKTGDVYDGPFRTLGYGSPYLDDGGSDELEYKKTSRILIPRGCPDDKNCGTYYYEWKDHRFAKLQFHVHGPLL